MSDNILPYGIYRVEFSSKQRCFHFNRNLNEKKDGWTSLRIMSNRECMDFADYMDKKYVSGRSSGILPPIYIVKLELDLFLELRAYRRKLAGRK